MEIKADEFGPCCNIRLLRTKKNMTIEDLAEKSGVPLAVLEQLERGTLPEELMLDDIVALARVLRCKLHELFR